MLTKTKRIKTNTLIALCVAMIAGLGCEQPEFTEEDATDQELDLTEGARGTIVWKLGDRYEELAYHVTNGLVITGGDMVLGSSENVRRELDIVFSNHDGGVGWPNNEIVYMIDPNISTTLRNRINTAIGYWNSRSMFKLTPRTGSEYYLRFRENDPDSNPRCMAESGYRGNIPFRNHQSIWLNDTSNRRCSITSVTHEIGHALGLFHEQQRSDRDLYVEVLYDNVEPGRATDFDQKGQAFGPYNYRSLMHYNNRVAGKTYFEVGPDGVPEEKARITLRKRGESPACTDDSRPECVVGRRSANHHGRDIITNLDLAGAVRANHGSMSSAYRLKNRSTQKCLRGTSTDGHVVAGNTLSMSSCGWTSTRRWYQSTDADTGDKLLINRSGRVCLTRHTRRGSRYLRVERCGLGSSQAATMSPLGGGRYRVLLASGDCLTDLGGSSPLPRACDGDDDQVWEKM